MRAAIYASGLSRASAVVMCAVKAITPRCCNYIYLSKILSGCTLLVFSPFCLSQEGKVIFSVELITAGNLVRQNGSPVIMDKTGIFYYYKEASPGEYGPTITGYQFANGAIVGVGGSGSIGSEIFLAELMTVPLKNFDVATEIESTIASLRLEAEKAGTSYSPPMVLDGSEYKITFDFNDINLSYTAWNPGPLIDEIAKYNSNIKNLNDVIDLFAANYGRSAMGLGQ